MYLSIIVPAYNEQETLPILLDRILAVDFPWPCEIIIVNDGSTDKTAEVAKKLKAEHPDRISVLDQPINLGKGAAIISGLTKAQGKVVIIQDADLEYDPAQLPKLVEPIKQGRAQVVYGSRFLGRIKSMSFGHFWGNRVLTQLTNWLYGSRLTDMETCYKAIARPVLAKIELEQRGFGIEVELTAKILRQKVTIIELPITYEARSRSQGKKIDYRDGLRAAGYLIHYRFFDRRSSSKLPRA